MADASTQCDIRHSASTGSLPIASEQAQRLLGGKPDRFPEAVLDWLVKVIGIPGSLSVNADHASLRAFALHDERKEKSRASSLCKILISSPEPR
jgi:hypothetical protein